MRVRIHAPFIVKLIEQDNLSHFICIKGLPKNTKIERIVPVLDGTYQGLNSFDIVVSHPEFREIKNTKMIPVFYPEFTKVE